MADGSPQVPVHAFVCGHPIAHSRSPMIHGYWLKAYGLNGSYRAIDVEPSEFPEFLRSLPESGFAGGNITIPHKKAAFIGVGYRDEAAQSTGAVNTLWLEDGHVCGGNTDVAGFAGNLDQFAPEWRKAKSAVVIGAGGAARAVTYALKQAGIGEIRVANRTPERAAELKDRFGDGVTASGLEALREVLAEADLLVNTTSLGMHEGDELPADPDLLPDHAIVTDIVYVPLETPLLAQAARRGLKTVDGLGMLLHQAAPAFRKWFGVMPEVTDELRALVVADIGQSR
ncbi:shikimate dehydrogenase [Mesorhizobium sp. BAC0120]|uniref:shikimate dehydrogenase n=1 Tax=Mesorhizobium sp. BAC0120 TaxID=3090670 RepID=UPI00298C15BB|nr:shikimate dehydrogenase [Mesorhizobium sp. BAC0120]MDW6024490.1 shikimate dehydrogenase [Mesorhizobium sp. BAC0120]